MPATRSVLIAGGGVAALEAALALRKLAGERVDVTLIAPERHFTCRPVSVLAPFGDSGPHRFPLAAIAEEAGAELMRDVVDHVEPGEHRVLTQASRSIPYDDLLVATGCAPSEPLRGAITYRGEQDALAVRLLADTVRDGEVIAFAAAPDARWTLPIYELALLTAEHQRRMSISAGLALFTPEVAPLEILGTAASTAVRDELASAGIELHTHSPARSFSNGELWVGHEGPAHVDHVVAQAGHAGLRLSGLPHDHADFLPVDERSRVLGAEGVFAAGDGTDHPIKQGGVATHQARAAAAEIARRAGAPEREYDGRLFLRGLLLTGHGVLYMQRELGVPESAGEVSSEPLWWPANKIAGRHLAPFLARHVGLADADAGDAPAVAATIAR